MDFFVSIGIDGGYRNYIPASSPYSQIAAMGQSGTPVGLEQREAKLLWALDQRSKTAGTLI
ncbi:MAG: hypothetical protein ACLFPQ_00790 [Candidatus Woesearchaeota archaeon]